MTLAFGSHPKYIKLYQYPSVGDNATPYIDIRTDPVESRRVAANFIFAEIKAILAEHGLE